MRYANVSIAGFGYELAPNVITSEDLEDRLKPVYNALHLQPGQLEALTGIIERRYWDTGYSVSQGAIAAGQKALAASAFSPSAIGMFIYGGVCRENLEPATACAVADELGIGAETQIYDISNACLGVLNAMVQIANAIELGQIQAGMVVSCETSRQIVDATIDRILETMDMDVFKETIATLTGGSGAVALVLCRSNLSHSGRRLLGGVARCAVQHHRLCTWGPDTSILAANRKHVMGTPVMRTDSVGVLQHGVTLGIDTFRAFKNELDWTADKPDKVICHQVGSTHQRTILESIGVDESKDFSTYRYLGNIGTVSLPITAAIADERGFFQPGDDVGFLGIGSGLNCLMLGLQW